MRSGLAYGRVLPSAGVTAVETLSPATISQRFGTVQEAAISRQGYVKMSESERATETRFSLYIVVVSKLARLCWRQSMPHR